MGERSFQYQQRSAGARTARGKGGSEWCALISVRLPVEEMACRAVRLRDGAGLPALTGSPGLLLAPLLVVRDSTPPPRAGTGRWWCGRPGGMIKPWHASRRSI
ncbi:MAG TPA: hypothetical protein VHH34_19210 [Pseudonocardiaceae bacterium]|nr:hypothetical protein [Pseudonocardiaceae bacterium]